MRASTSAAEASGVKASNRSFRGSLVRRGVQGRIDAGRKRHAQDRRAALDRLGRRELEVAGKGGEPLARPDNHIRQRRGGRPDSLENGA